MCKRCLPCVWILLLLPIATLQTQAGGAAKRPNILVIFTDDHGYTDLSCHNLKKDIKTPHIDSLAAGGVRMTSGYVTAPQCVPSRAGLLSGRYQNRFGVESNGKSLKGFNEQLTIAEQLKKAGYVTGMIDKWHLGPANEITEHGFDDVFYQGGSWINFSVDGKDAKPGSTFKDMYHLDAGSAAAKAFIKRHHKNPFFLYVAYRAPHVPLDPPKKYLDRFQGKMPERRRKALAMLSAVDDGVGGILKSLREYDIERQTLIFFISDNGAPLKIFMLDAPGGGPGWDGSLNFPLLGEKGMLTEGGVRVPFLVYWKGTIPPQKEYDHPVISLDVAATSLALAGLPPNKKHDGVNLLPYLTGKKKTAPHETLYWRWIAQSAVREGQWKYLRGGSREYLFDVSTLDGEKHNVIKKHPEIAARLKAKLNNWAKELSPPGLATGKMSATWEAYYDYYLDGKPAPKRLKAGNTASIRGWITRNGKSTLQAGFLNVSPMGKKQAPFLVVNKVNFAGPITAVVRLRTKQAGRLGVAWRETGQKDFPPKQVVMFKCKKSADWQEHQLNLDTKRTVIHIRVLLPASGADVERIEFRSTNGKVLRKWDFTKGDS